MTNRIIRQLSICYYTMMALALVAAVGTYLLVMHDIITPINPLETAGQVIQYLIIFDMLLTVPGGLYFFKRQMAKLAPMEDKTEQHQLYRKYSMIRIVSVSNSMVFAIIAFYLMGAYQSMIWVAAISAIGWYFTKPTEAKMQIELTPADPNAETY